MKALLEMFREHNRYAKDYSTMAEYLQWHPLVTHVNIEMRANLNALHKGNGCLPSADEVAVVYTFDDLDRHTLDSMVVYTEQGDDIVPHIFNINTGSAELMQFPLLNP